jgi:hypothetical protein
LEAPDVPPTACTLEKRLGCWVSKGTLVNRVAAERTVSGFTASLWPLLVQIQEKGQVLSDDRRLHRRVREFYRELARLADGRFEDARNSDEERLL